MTPDYKAFPARLENAQGLARIREISFKHALEHITNLPDEELNEYFDSYVEDVTTDKSPFKPPFSLEPAKKIGRDTWRHILSTKNRPDYDAIFNQAFIKLIHRLEIAKETRFLQEWEEFMYTHMLKLIDAEAGKAEKLIQSLRSTPLDPPYTLYPSTIFVKMLSEITHEMFGCILDPGYFHF